MCSCWGGSQTVHSGTAVIAAIEGVTDHPPHLFDPLLYKHHAGHLDIDVLRHHRPHVPVLHHLHALILRQHR